jgi:4-alpha-glucanotransferase
MKKRQSGVLMHISSLPGAYGIGSFGQSAYDFVDFLVRTKQRYWQILPLGTTSYGDSPYQSFSAFAGNTHFIDLDILVEQGLLEATDLEGVDFGSNPEEVDYAKIYYARRPLLEKAVKRFLEVGDVKDFEKFAQENQSWLELFAEYMAIKEHFDNLAWTEWPDAAARARKASTLESYREKLADKLVYHRVTQYFFFQQWLKLKGYANDHHIEIVGDMPMWQKTQAICGQIHISSKQIKTGKQHTLQDAPLMSSLQTVSFGVTQSMTGKQWIKTVTNGGLNACVKASKSTISFVSTTSVDLSLTGKSLLVLRQQHLVNG